MVDLMVGLEALAEAQAWVSRALGAVESTLTTLAMLGADTARFSWILLAWCGWQSLSVVLLSQPHKVLTGSDVSLGQCCRRGLRLAAEDERLDHLKPHNEPQDFTFFITEKVVTVYMYLHHVQ